MHKIDRFREEILEVDLKIIELLAIRQQFVMKMLPEKERLGLNVEQPEIWEKHSQIRSDKALHTELSTDYVERLFEQIHDESKRVQRDLRKPKD